jgi:hypothetical protein
MEGSVYRGATYIEGSNSVYYYIEGYDIRDYIRVSVYIGVIDL